MAPSTAPDLRPLPPGWHWVVFCDVSIGAGQYGSSAKAFAEGKGLPMLRMGNLREGRVDWSDLKYVQLPEAEEAGYRLAAGDLLFNRTNSVELVGKSAVFDGSLNAVFASYLIRFRLNPTLADPDFVCAYINSPFGRAFVADNVGRAIGQANISASTMQRMPIPLPPLAEQKRIARLVLDQLVAVECARTAAEARLQEVKRLSRALLGALLEGGTSEGERAGAGWKRVRLGDTVRITASQVDPRVPEFGRLPHVSSEHIVSGTGKLLPLRGAAEDGMMSGKYLFEPGDVLYSKIRPYLRKVAMVDFAGLCSADIYPIKVGQEVSAEFLAWRLLADDFSLYAESESRRARMPKLNREQLFAWEFNLPPLAEQQRVVGALKGSMTTVRRAFSAATEAASAINALPAALLRQAFSGEP